MHCRLIKVLLLISALTVVSVISELEWYRNTNFYQIYPRSFMDSNNDGIGDLQGIKSKLSYLKDLGIDGVWLSPIYKSPNADFGYDISDYRDIDPQFGTLNDFDELIAECKKLGLRLILDFVPNHSSDEHEWFKKSERNESGFEDFYIWRNPKIDEISNAMIPPTNWMSGFRYSAWRWSEIRQQMYYHFFHRKQPDLNYRNPTVVQEMKNILTYWMDKGVDGFRIDAVPTIFEQMNEDGSFNDEPRSYNPDCDQYDHCSLNNIYTENQNESYDMIYQWRKLVDDYSTINSVDRKVIMVESYAEINLNMLYYGDNVRPGAHFPFNFELIKRATKDSTAEDFRNIVEEWIYKMPSGHIANWVLGNHDQHRIASRLGEERGDMLNILLQTLPGTAITYQGEELVMTDVHLTWNETVDPAACNSNEEIYESRSRDPARAPFPWDDSKNGGFSLNDTTWLPTKDNYKTINVKLQENADNSHLKIFKRLTKIRKDNIFRSGGYEGKLSNNNNVYTYKRQNGNDLAIIVLNFGKNEETVNVKQLFPQVASFLKVYTSSLESGLKDDELIDSASVKVKGDKGIVFLNSSSMVKASFILFVVSLILSFVR